MTTNVLRLLQREKGLFWAGIGGIVLGLISVIFFLIQGNAIPPEGEWSKAITFNLAIGIFSLSLAFLLPYLTLKKKQRSRFVYPLLTSFWVGYLIETMQNARGYDPRFTQAGSIFDQILGAGLGIVALVISTSLIYFMFLVFQQTNQKYAPMFLSLRYANFSILLGTLSGVWMSIIQGRVTTDAVDIMILHFVGFHGLQAIPLIAWFFEKGKTSSTHAMKIIHTAGGAWLLLCILLFLQTMRGFSIYEPTILLILAIFSFLLWGALLLYSFVNYWKNRKDKQHV